MKKLRTILITIVATLTATSALSFGTIALAAPQSRLERTILPEVTNTYELGTSTQRWLRINTNYASTSVLSATTICLTGDTCRTTWPTGGGGTGVGTVSTSSPETPGNLAYWTSTLGYPATLGKVATTTIAFSGPFTGASALGALVGGSNSTVVWTGLATTSQPASSNLLVSNGLAGVYGVATTTVSCTGNASCTQFTTLGGTPITINVSGGGTGLSTTSPVSAGNVLYYSSTGAGSATGVATTSLSVTGPFTIAAPIGVLTNGAVVYTGLATTSQPASSNLLVSNGGAGVYAVATTTVACSGTVSCTTFTTLGGTPITITGSGGGSWPFTPSTYGSQAVQATSTGLWLTGSPLSLIASSTFATYASTTQFSNSGNTYLTGLSAGNLYLGSGSIVNTFATSSETCTGPLSCTSFDVLKNGGAITIAQSTGAVDGYLRGVDFTTFNNNRLATSSVLTPGQLVYATGDAVGNKTAGVATTTLSGTANQLTITGSPVILGTASTLSLPNHVIFPSSFQVTSASTSNATTTATQYFTSAVVAASSLLRTDSTGKLSAVTVGSNLSFDGTTLSASAGGGTYPFYPLTVGATTTSATSSPLFSVGGFYTPITVAIGTSSPFARMAIHANPTDPTFNRFLFAIGSTTAAGATSTLFSVKNTGETIINGNVGIGITPTVAFQVSGTGIFTTVAVTNTASVAASNATVYQPTSNTLTVPVEVFTLSNDQGTNGIINSMTFQARNASFAYQKFYIGAVSSTTGTTPYVVLGQQTGASQYTERLRISDYGWFGYGSTSPYAQFSIHAPTNSTTSQTLFAIGSSTATATSTFFTVGNTGLVSIGSAVAGSNFWTLANMSGNFYLSTTSAPGGATSSPMTPLAIVGNPFGARVGINIGAPRATLDLYEQNGTGCSPGIFMGGNLNGDSDAGICRNTNNDSANNDLLQFGSFTTGTFQAQATFDLASGRLGIGSSTPWALLGVASSTWGQNPLDYKRPLFSVATSSDSFGGLFNIFATSTVINGGYGYRISNLINQFGFGGILDNFYFPGTMNTYPWHVYDCVPGLGGLGSYIADSANTCGAWQIQLDNTGGSANTNSGFTMTTNGAASGAGLFLGAYSARQIYISTSTPQMEVVARINNPQNATSTLGFILGVTNQDPTSSTMEAGFQAGCYFTATSTTNNWVSVCTTGTATTTVDTGVASTTNSTATGDFMRFRIETSKNLVRFYIQLKNGNIKKVAEISTNIPTSVPLDPGLFFTRLIAGIGSTGWELTNANAQFKDISGF